MSDWEGDDFYTYPRRVLEDWDDLHDARAAGYDPNDDDDDQYGLRAVSVQISEILNAKDIVERFDEKAADFRTVNITGAWCEGKDDQHLTAWWECKDHCAAHDENMVYYELTPDQSEICKPHNVKCNNASEGNKPCRFKFLGWIYFERNPWDAEKFFPSIIGRYNSVPDARYAHSALFIAKLDISQQIEYPYTMVKCARNTMHAKI